MQNEVNHIISIFSISYQRWQYPEFFGSNSESYENPPKNRINPRIVGFSDYCLWIFEFVLPSLFSIINLDICNLLLLLFAFIFQPLTRTPLRKRRSHPPTRWRAGPRSLGSSPHQPREAMRQEVYLHFKYNINPYVSW